MDSSYDIKFADLIRLCKEAKTNGINMVTINHPEALGDTYKELVESLNILSEYDLLLAIVPRTDRDTVRDRRHDLKLVT